MAMSTGAVVYYWLFAPIAPLALAVLLAIGSLFAGKFSARVIQAADGALLRLCSPSCSPSWGSSLWRIDR